MTQLEKTVKSEKNKIKDNFGLDVESFIGSPPQK